MYLWVKEKKEFSQGGHVTRLLSIPLTVMSGAGRHCYVEDACRLITSQSTALFGYECMRCDIHYFVTCGKQVLSIAFQCFNSDFKGTSLSKPCNCIYIKKRLKMSAGYFMENGNSPTSAVKLEVKLRV